MMPSQHLLELSLNLQRRVAQVEQDNQQKKAELAQLRQEYGRLQQSEARYRQLFENAPVSMLFINTEGYITEMNRAAEHLFGLSMEQLNKQACPIFTNTQLVENGTLPYMLRALAGETVIEEPTYYDSSKDFDGGKLNYGKGHYFPIRDSEEVVREIVEIAPDFSDLLASQQTLQQERELAATERIKLLGTIAQVANLLLRSPDYTCVLPDVVRLLGEAVGSDRCTVLQDVLHPSLGKPGVIILEEWCKSGVLLSVEHTPVLEDALWELIPQFYEALLNQEIANFLVSDLQEPARTIFTEQGNTSMIAVPIIVNGQFWGVVSFDNCGEPKLYDEAEIAILKIAADSLAAAIERQAKDEELRQSEVLYRSLFEISNEGIYRWQLDQPISVELPVDEQVELVYRYHSFAQANDALAKMYGLAKAEDIVGMRLAQVHPQDSAITLEMMRAICGNGWQIRNAESEEIDANGQRRYYLNSIISFIENGSVSSGWGTQIDMTELREAQQALLQAEQARAELLKTMTTIANHLLRSTDYRLILPDVLQLLGEAARADRCSLVQNITAPASGKSAMRMNAEWCRPGIQASIAHTPALESALLWSDFAELYERLIRGETVQFFGTDLCASLLPLFESQGNTAMLMVPIVVQGEFWGVFGFDYCGEVRRFEELDQSIFAIAVDSIAAAIERQQKDQALMQAEQARAAELAKANNALKRNLDSLATQPELEAFLQSVVNEAAAQTNAANAHLFLYDEHTDSLSLSVATDNGGDWRSVADMELWKRAIPAHSTPAWETITSSRTPAILPLEEENPLFWAGTFEWHQQRGHTRGIAAPLWLGEKPLGFLGLAFTAGETFTPLELELIQALAQQATLAIELTSLAEQSRHTAILEERNRIAREIHDTLAQAFTGISIHLGIAHRYAKLESEAVCSLIEQATELAHVGLTEARRSVWELQPDADEYRDLVPLLERVLQQMTSSPAVRAQMRVQGTPYSLPPDVGLNLLRIGQEALTNALKYAQAQQLIIKLQFAPASVSLRVQDDGCGFDPNSQTDNGGFGLVGMQQRCQRIGGQLTINSQPGQGTAIVVEVPLVQGEATTK